MNPPKSNTTVRITTAADLGPASGFTNSPGMTVIELKTDEEKGHHYLQLSLTALKELATLLEDQRLSTSQKAVYHEAYNSNVDSYDDMVILRDRILAQKKSFRRFIINLFVRETDAQRYHKVTLRNYSSIKRTSDDISRRLLPNKNDILGSLSGSTQGQTTVCEESPRDVVEGGLPVTDLPPNETIRGVHVDAHGEQEEQEVFETLIRLAQFGEADEDEDDRTIRPSPSQSRPPSPSPSCTIVWNNYNYNINQSVVSFDSESNGVVLNIGADGGVGSSSC